jgi:hypothetical protein
MGCFHVKRLISKFELSIDNSWKIPRAIKNGSKIGFHHFSDGYLIHDWLADPEFTTSLTHLTTKILSVKT